MVSVRLAGLHPPLQSLAASRAAVGQGVGSECGCNVRAGSGPAARQREHVPCFSACPRSHTCYWAPRAVQPACGPSSLARADTVPHLAAALLRSPRLFLPLHLQALLPATPAACSAWMTLPPGSPSYPASNVVYCPARRVNCSLPTMGPAHKWMSCMPWQWRCAHNVIHCRWNRAAILWLPPAALTRPCCIALSCCSTSWAPWRWPS